MASTSFESLSSSSSSSTRIRRKYDVFLSFRGEDTRKKFTDHLYTALIQAGIHTFMDDNELPRGEEISPQLLKAIEGSRVSIVVFSKDYASSAWCLDELVKILECRQKVGQVVNPIFYDIDPSDVRKQTGNYAKAFDEHEERFKEEMEKVDKWKEALLEAGNLSGWGLKNDANGYESRFIKKIVNEVVCQLGCKSLHVAKYQVGIDAKVHLIISLLRAAKKDVGIVGIHGMAGIGKTTIAKAAFNSLSYEFEGSSFLFDVKQISDKPNGIAELQERLLHDILKPNVWKISDAHEGVNLIKERLGGKKVLVVFDNVDRGDQLDALMQERSWFGPESRIIITTKNVHLLKQLEVDGIYHVEELDEEESLEVFSWHAFRDTHPKEDFVELSKKVVDYCKGLPLALEILGSHLFKRSIAEWEIDIEQWQKIPHDDIQIMLKVSFDALNADMKDIFLDIACFFVGRDKEHVAKILGARYDFNPEIGFRTLIQRSLVTIGPWNELRVHDILRDMGREIIRQMSPNHPGKRNRIWLHKDAYNVLYRKMGTKIVEGIVIDVLESEAIPLSTESFRKMRFLKLLQINGVILTGPFKWLSKELIWFCWHECPLKSLPSDFMLDNLAVLDMQYSNIKELWKDTKILRKLKILNLSYCKYLVKTPNFLGLFNLERLILENCTSLVEVQQSIGHLKSLVFLNLKGCCKLKSLPESMGGLKSLETLNIIKCTKLEKLPEHLGDMESLTELVADGTAIKELPSSIEFLKNLKKLSLQGCNFKRDLPSTSWLSSFASCLPPRSLNSKTLLPASLVGLSSLRYLYLSHCGWSEGATSIDLGSLSSLQVLDLSGNKFFQLPSGMGGLHKLVKLYVEDCKNLLSISELPLSLRFLCANNCTSMERLSIKSKAIQRLILSGCQNLKEIQGMEGVSYSLPILFLDDCKNLSNKFKKNLVQALCRGERHGIFFPCDEIPDWFSHHQHGSSLSFHVPEVSDVTLQALVVWVVFAATEREIFYPFSSAIIKNKRSDLQLFKRSTTLTFRKSSSNHSWVNYISFTGLPCAMKGGEELELSVEINDEIVVEKCGVHFTALRAHERIYC